MPSDPLLSATEHECIYCGGPGTHRHNQTGNYLCCGHASHDIDAEPIRNTHSCERFYTVERFGRDMECEHRDNPNPPTGDLVPCHDTAEWAITTSRFPGDPFDPDHPGAPSRTRYCLEHFADRLGEVLDGSALRAATVRNGVQES